MFTYSLGNMNVRGRQVVQLWELYFSGFKPKDSSISPVYCELTVHKTDEATGPVAVRGSVV